MSRPRTVGVVRVSAQGERDDASFHSPHTQRDRIVASAEDVIDVFDETDVSGTRALSRRPGLLRAVEMVEHQQADHIVVAYFDRLVRSLKVQLEVIERVEKAGGEIYALDHGRLTNGSAATRLSTNMMGAVFQFYAEVTSEKVAEAHRRKINNNHWPGRVPPGLRRNPDTGVLEPDEHAALIRGCFELRDRGGSLTDIQALLADHGIVRSKHGVGHMLTSKLYLGELHYGQLESLGSHPPIVDRSLWERVQVKRSEPGRRSPSTALLAKQGVLLCAGCGSRMVVSGRGRVYSCEADAGRCSSPRPSIRIPRLDDLVRDRLLAHSELMRLRGAASDDGRAGRELDRAQNDLDAAVRAFAGLTGEQAATDRLRELTAVRDVKRRAAEAVSDQGVSATMIRRMGDWDQLTLDGRRAIVRACVVSITVAPATARQWQPGRVAFTFRG